MFPAYLGYYSIQHTSQTRDLHTPPCAEKDMNLAPLLLLVAATLEGWLLNPQKF